MPSTLESSADRRPGLTGQPPGLPPLKKSGGALNLVLVAYPLRTYMFPLPCPLPPPVHIDVLPLRIGVPFHIM